MTASDGNGGSAVRLPGGGAMPLLGFGTWMLRGAPGYDAVRHAIDVGYRHLDTATMYRNEAEVGRALRDSGVPREDVFVTTKLPPGNAGRERETIEASLRDLGTDHVDLWLVHWPPPSGASVGVWERLLEIRTEGLARAVGVSNYDLDEIDELVAATGEAPAVNQIPWGPTRHDPDLLAGHRDRGIVVEGYSPFKNTDLGEPVLAEIARTHGVTPAQVVLRWHLDHDVVVIPKSAAPERIESNFDVEGLRLTDAERGRIDALSEI